MRANVCFVHPPSIYDFRQRDLRSGPISDVIPSTPIFEMYPVGLISMLNSMVSNGYNARISNVAVHMLYSKEFDVRKYLSGIEADIYGVDLHWLPHAHGALNIAKMIKELHPNSKVLMGGFSSTYFAEEIMQNYPFVDFVLRGDLQEEAIVDLSEAVERNRDLASVPNLAYREGTKVVFNKTSNDPEAIKRVFLNYDLLFRNAIKYGDVRGHLPYKMWLKNPSAMTLIEHGCQYNCGFCGGSHFAFSKNYFNISPLFRDPELVARELNIIQDRLGTPVFIAGDLNAAGPKFRGAFFKAIKERDLDMSILTEHFVPPPEEYFKELSRVIPRFKVEISPDSSNEQIRAKVGRHYTNHELEKAIGYAKDYGARKFDVYFMIGLPGQRKEDVIADVRYSENIMSKYIGGSMKMYAFLSPMTPFLDPGSLFYEMPSKYGITLRAKTLQDYYNLLDKGRDWEDYFNYETQEMTTKEIVEVTYESGKIMAEARERLGIISKQEKSIIVKNIDAYRMGNDTINDESMGMHLSYMVKEIEWSRRHHITFFSFLIFLYRYYDSFRDLLEPH